MLEYISRHFSAHIKSVQYRDNLPRSFRLAFPKSNKRDFAFCRIVNHTHSDFFISSEHPWQLYRAFKISDVHLKPRMLRQTPYALFPFTWMSIILTNSSDFCSLVLYAVIFFTFSFHPHINAMTTRRSYVSSWYKAHKAPCCVAMTDILNRFSYIIKSTVFVIKAQHVSTKRRYDFCNPSTG